MTFPIRRWLPLLAGGACLVFGAGEGRAASTFTSDAKGNVFLGEKGVVVLRLAPADDVVGGTVRILDENKTVRGEAPIPAGAAEVALPLSAKGYYGLEASIRRKDGAAETVAATAAVIGPEVDPALRMKSYLGLWTVHGDPDLVVAAGGRWDRQMVGMSRMTPDSLDAPAPAPASPAPAPPRFTEVGVFRSGLPAWMFDTAPVPDKGSGGFFQAPGDWGKLKKLVKAYVREPHAAPFPPYFEIYNEPEWAWKGSPDDLVRFETTVADAIHEARPDVRVLGPGMSSIRIRDGARIDLEKFAKRGLFDHLDGLVVHAYVDGTPPEAEFIQRVIELKAWLAKIGKPGFPIHFTEFGWTTADGTWQRPIDELTQARYLVRSLVLLGTQGVENATYFVYVYKAKNPGESGFSVAHEDGTPKPAYAAFSNLARWIAGAGNTARWLKLRPSTHLVLFPGPQGVVGVAWDTRGEQPFTLPGAVDRASDMMGRPLAPSASGTVTLSPSPIFVHFRDAGLDRVALNPSLKVMRGNEVPLPASGGEDWTVPAPLGGSGGRLRAPSDAPDGSYLLLAKTSQGWQAQPVEVVSPLALSAPRLEWPAGSPAPVLSAEIESHATAAVEARLVARLDAAPDLFSPAAPLAPGAKQTMSLPLDKAEPGVRYQGRLQAEARLDGRLDRSEKPFDVTLVSASSLPAGASSVEWKGIPEVDFTRWDPLGEPMPGLGATLQAAYGADGLHVLVRVREADHHDEKSAQALWTGDSLQFGLDADAQKTWEANDLFGLKGHRVFEYGVGWNGSDPLAWRWISYLPELPGESGDTGLNAKVSRDDGVTRYEVVFPWKSLGLDAAPKPGTAIGFSLTVNKWDAVGARRGLRLFHGVSEAKDPQAFGLLWLR